MARRSKSGVNPVPVPEPVEEAKPAEQAAAPAEQDAAREEPATGRDPLDTAMEMIAADGWRAFSLISLARELDVPVAQVYAQFPARLAVLSELGRRLDAKMLDLAASELEELNPRERLFELMMRRLDAMQPYKVALRKIGRDARGDLEAGLVGLGNLSRAVVEMVDAAGVRGPGNLLARHAVGLLYLRVLRVWMRDDDPEQAQTLAELDKGLARMERTAQGMCRFMRNRRAAKPEAAAA